MFDSVLGFVSGNTGLIAGGGTAGVPSGRSSAAGANTGGGTGCGGYPSGGGGTGGPGIIVIKI